MKLNFHNIDNSKLNEESESEDSHTTINRNTVNRTQQTHTSPYRFSSNTNRPKKAQLIVPE